MGEGEGGEEDGLTLRVGRSMESADTFPPPLVAFS
jgi:hypothetical protein